MTKTVLRAIAAFIVALVVGVWTFGYHSFEFKGGLRIRDSGFFSYPRYSAEIGELPLWNDGKYQFTVRGLPPGPLDFVIRVPDVTDSDKAQLASLSTNLSTVIAESSGRQICSATGRLSDVRQNDRHTWMLDSIGPNISLWQPQCKQLSISRFNTYIIQVTVLGADDSSPHKMLIPILRGGGNELP
jgi:hypothetical protein